MDARTPQLVEQQWTERQSKIYASAFKRAQGTYQLVAILQEADSEVEDELVADEDAANQPRAGKRIDLGVVELRVEEEKLILSVGAVGLSQTPGQLGIRIDDPASLRSFNKPELTKLPLATVSQPLDLLPEGDGAWSGQLRLPDGQILIVSLEPEE